MDVMHSEARMDLGGPGLCHSLDSIMNTLETLQNGLLIMLAELHYDSSNSMFTSMGIRGQPRFTSNYTSVIHLLPILVSTNAPWMSSAVMTAISNSKSEDVSGHS